MIFLDYETRSHADLKEVGMYNYADHETTEIICLSMYDYDTKELKTIYPIFGETMPKEWVAKLNDADLIAAFNAAFDREIHNGVGADLNFPIRSDNSWYCVAAQSRVNALPSNLEDACKAAKSPMKKNPDGKALIKALCIPREDGTFNEDRALIKKMGAYCEDDVMAMVALFDATRPMTQVEHTDWLLCEKMNGIGVKVDRELAALASSYAHVEQKEISDKLTELTDGEITKPTQYQRIKKYIFDALDPTDGNDTKLRQLMTVFKDGKKKESLDKDVRETVLNLVDNNELHLYEDIEELIRLLDAASASSVAKFKRMTNLSNPDDHRVRGAFIHAGASQTHRFSSKGLQMHNMRRDAYTEEQALEVKAKMKAGEDIPDVMQSLAKLLRPALIPAEGNKFVVGDWSAIEARALPWLAGTAEADKKLDLFRQGIDVYVEAAKAIFKNPNLTAEDKERQIGKVAELALGYGGAAGAFSSMAKNYGLALPDAQVATIVKMWRNANAWAVKFWAELENAARRAIRNPNQTFTAGRVEYIFTPQLLGGTLMCILPDGTAIQYPFCRIEHTDRGDGLVALKAGIKLKAGTVQSRNHWGVVRLWGGLLAENITQAFCAALLRDAVRRCDEKKVGVIVAHVHDEIILETINPITEAMQLRQVMEFVPAWAEGLPLKAEPVILNRYGNH